MIHHKPVARIERFVLIKPDMFWRHSFYPMLVWNKEKSIRKHSLWDIWLSDWSRHISVEQRRTIEITTVRRDLIWLVLYFVISSGKSLEKSQIICRKQWSKKLVNVETDCNQISRKLSNLTLLQEAWGKPLLQETGVKIRKIMYLKLVFLKYWIGLHLLHSCHILGG